MLSFQNANPDVDLINSIFSYDVNKLEYTDSIKLSQFTIALSQYLIYFKSQSNQNKIDIRKKQRLFDGAVTQLLTKEMIKEYKTKTAASSYLVQTNEFLSRLDEEIENLKDQEILLDGIDKHISELIASFKRELTRRENEQWQTRVEH